VAAAGPGPRPRIVVLDSFAADQGEEPPFWDGLRALGELTVHARSDDAERVERCRGAAAVLINKVPLDGATIAALPDLRYIGLLATGTNVVDLAAARARDVAVTNVPAYAAESVAELVFAMILHFTHDVAGHAADVKAGGWARQPDFSYFLRPLRELAGKTLVVIGAGHIGRAVGRIGAAFGMSVVYAAAPGSTSPGRAPLAEALPAADVVTLHCPLTPTTAGLVDARFLGALRRDAILVNTGRGGLIDEAALLAALRGGHLRGVGLDVLSVEPPPADHPLLDAAAPWAARLVVTPHIGWGTVEALRRLERVVVDNLRAFLAGERLNRVD
jgi:glycerate dehydrogenase